jgi:hypothetical protein
MRYRIRRASTRWNQGVKSIRAQAGKLGWLLLWGLGVPIPILLVLFLLRGCT